MNGYKVVEKLLKRQLPTSSKLPKVGSIPFPLLLIIRPVVDVRHTICTSRIRLIQYFYLIKRLQETFRQFDMRCHQTRRERLPDPRLRVG